MMHRDTNINFGMTKALYCSTALRGIQDVDTLPLLIMMNSLFLGSTGL